MTPEMHAFTTHSSTTGSMVFFSEVKFGLKTFHIVHSFQPELIVFTKLKHTFELQSTCPINHCCQQINCKTIHSTGHVLSLSAYKY